MSLSQALNAAVAGLATTQSGMSLVAANVSNAETPGYVRKTLDQVTTAAGPAGVSVRVDGINRELDQFLQRQLQTESSGGAYADLKSQFYNRLQEVYGSPGSASSIDTVYNNFTTAMQALSTSPDDTSARANVVSSAQVLAQQLNSLTASVQGLRSDAESGLSDAVRNANDAMQAIAQDQPAACHRAKQRCVRRDSGGSARPVHQPALAVDGHQGSRPAISIRSRSSPVPASSSSARRPRRSISMPRAR